MIYSKSHQFIFCHVPKTGGTSLRQALKPFRPRWEQSLPLKVLRKLPGAEGNSLLYDFTNRPHTTCAKAQKLLRHSYDNLFAFALIREPSEWLLSCYRFFMLGHSRVRGSSRPVRNFEEYLQAMIELGGKKPSQGAMIIDLSGALLVDRIGLFSQIAAFANEVSDRLRLGLPQLEHLNINPSTEHAPESLDREVSQDQLMDFVSKYWGLDLAIWKLALSSSSAASLRGYRFDSSLIPAVDLEMYDPWGQFVWESIV